MTFDTIFEQVVALLKRQRRVSYRALARRFEIDEAFIDDLKAELLYVYETRVETDENGLQWSGGTEVVPGVALSVDLTKDEAGRGFPKR